MMMTQQTHTIKGKEINITLKEMNKRIIIRAVDPTTNKVLMAGNFDSANLKNAIERFVSFLSEVPFAR